jgi:hypothetical protein
MFVKEKVKMKNKAVFWLKLSFMVGAIVDGLAIIPMVVPWAAKIFWGFEDFTGIYYFAMGMGASLMLAWTLLLLWAYRQPLERRYIALFTIIILIGIAATEIILVSQGYIHLSSVLVSLVMQAVWLVLFSYSFIISGRAETAPVNVKKTS